jgi:DNA-binding NarL/FixJ family response regulator
VLVLSMHAEAQIVARVLRAGAAGYAPRTASRHPGGAVRKVAAKGRFIDPRWSIPWSSSALNPGSDSPHEQLSPRERRCSSASPPARRWAIADELHLSPRR